MDVCFAKHIAPEQGQAYWPDPELRDGEEIELAPSLKASRLTEDLRRMIGAACQTPGYGHLSDVLTYGFVCEDAPGTTFDADQKLARLVALSRLIYPSAHGFDYCARVYFNRDGSVNNIFGISGPLAHKAKEHRPWLTPQEIRDLGVLFRAYEALPVLLEPRPPGLPISAEPPRTSRKLPRRLHRALWNMAYAARVEPAHLRWLITSVAAEGLIESGKKARQAFIIRVPAISAELGCPISRKEADVIYDLRSRVAHSGWLSPNRTDKELDTSFVLLDRFVAGVLKRAIEDAAFRGAFECRETIAVRWPVEPESP